MISLRECVNKALEKKTAIGHFNISTIDGVWAVVDAAHELKLPVIVGVSEGERDYIGVKQIASVIKSIREERNQDIYLNADHTYSVDKVKEAIDAGFDSVIFDGANRPIEENIALTRDCVDYAHKSGRDVLVEGELGFIGTSSKVLSEIPKGAVVGESMMTDPDEAKKFVEKSGVDLLAPAIGNIHGVIIGGDPALNPERAMKISKAVGVPLVLHGASGNTADDIKKCIQGGVAIVHVNTELRIAYRSGLVMALQENPDEVSPYKYLKPAKLAMQKVVEDKLRIINNL